MEHIDEMKIYYTPNIAWQAYHSTIYIINESNGKIYLLKDTAADFWLLIQEQDDYSTMIERICEKYHISDEKSAVMKDFFPFVQSLIDYGIVEVKED